MAKEPEKEKTAEEELAALPKDQLKIRRDEYAKAIASGTGSGQTRYLLSVCEGLLGK